MRVYLLTFHGSLNYGAVLQSYALAKTIEDIGCECVIIDYNRKTHHKNYLKINYRSFRGIIYQTIQFPNKYIIHRKFDSFVRKKLNITDKSYDGFGGLNDFQLEQNEILLVGSDQVWNCDLTENNYHYFLDFAEIDDKYSYAASFGVSDIEAWNNKDILSTLLKQFRSISVREESGQKILEKNFSLHSTVVCDPTFLLDKKQWDCLIKGKTIKIVKKYILIFMITYDQRLVDCALEISKKKNISIINIAYTVTSIPGVKNVKNLAPDEWLAYISRAEYVFTNSFHGFALSLNYQRQVWVTMTKGSRNSRILDLAARYGISNRVISDDGIDFSKIDYCKVSFKIKEDKIKSRSFLEEVLNA